MKYDDTNAANRSMKEAQFRNDSLVRPRSSVRSREEEWDRHPPRAIEWEEGDPDDEEEPEWDGPDDRDAADYWRYWGYEVDDDGEPIPTEEENAALRAVLRKIWGAKG